MKSLMTGLTAVLLCATITTGASGNEMQYLVEIEDRAGEATYELVTPAELKTIENQIKEESKVYRKALSAAQKEWKENAELRGTFPSSAVSMRKVTRKGTFTDPEKAAKKLTSYEDRYFEKQSRDAERDKARAQMRHGRDKDRLAKAEQRESEREARYSQARDIFEQKLEELLPKENAEEKSAEGGIKNL
jgi:hypothetical protein